MDMRRGRTFGGIFAIFAAAVLFAPAPAASAPAEDSGGKSMHISATAQGTSTQMGRIVSIDIIVNEYSTTEDQQALLEAFHGGGSRALARAVSKMSSKGRIKVTGTLGYDLNYIKLFDTPEGRRIRFVTDRAIRFGEKWSDTRSSDYDLSAGEIILAGGDGKSSGTLLPACRFSLDKQNELELELYQNAWKLVNIRVD
jgi:hypothetical protein